MNGPTLNTYSNTGVRVDDMKSGAVHRAGWAVATLGEVAEWGSGGTPRAGTAAFYNGHIPWAVIADLNDRVVNRTQRSITEAGLAGSSAKMVPAGAVLIAMYGSIGKLGVAGTEMTTNQAIAHAIPGPRVLPKYLFHFFRSQREALQAAGKGATQSNIGQGVLKTWPISFPVVLDEQRRVVDVLEEHLSHLDANTEILSSATRRLKVLQESLTTRAITGYEVPGPRRPAELALDNCHDGSLPDLPIDWRWLRLGDVAEVVGGITKDGSKQGRDDLIEVPYLRVANVQRAALALENVSTIRVPEHKAEALALQPGDVLLNEGGDRDKLARGWVWEGQIADCIHQNHVFRARVTEPGLSPYFLSWTTNTIGSRWAEINGKQSVNLASISLRMIRRMPVVVPPPHVSTTVVNVLHEKLESLSRLQHSLSVARDRGMRLRRALLSAAFSGQLTGRSSDTEIIEELAQ